MKKNKLSLLLLSLLATFFMVSCGNDDNTVEEYPDWQKTNETYFTNLYNTAKTNIAAGDANWKIIRKWSLEDTVKVNADDNIVVQVLNKGTGSGCPMYTDSVYVHFLGRLLPSTSYPEGYVFAQTYTGDFDPTTSIPVQYAVSGLVDGFTTALLNMHIGDTWRVYIPYKLGYETTDYNGVPAYSTLIYDITLAAYYHPGKVVPDWRARRN